MDPAPAERAALDGRAAAAGAVAAVLGGRGFAGEWLRAARSAGRLAGREAALAMELAQGALRHMLTIEQILGRLARFARPRVPAPLRAVLYTAVYQLVWLERIPPFAAVDRAVALARDRVGGRAPGMVNAVLRRVSDALAERCAPWTRLDPAQVRTGWDRACRFRTAALPPAGADPQTHLAAATGERPARYAELVARYGPERAEAVAWASQGRPATVLHRNPLRATPEAFERSLRVAYGAEVELAGDVAFAPPSVPVGDLPAFQDGLAYVQDLTAHAAVRAVEARPGEQVLDLCAAPGGKSIALALALRDRGRVVACDAAPPRLARVDANVARLRLTCVRTRAIAADAPELVAEGPRYDAVLVDAPCTNTGVIARRPEARLGLTPRKLASLVALQQRLLRQAARLVRPGGRLVYSTCSIEPAENEEVVAAFLADHPGWRLDAEETTLPAWGPRWADWRDGGYYARLRPPPGAAPAQPGSAGAS